MCRHRRRAPWQQLFESLDELHRKVHHIMTQQDDLNALVARIDTATAGIRQDIADLKAAAEAGQPLDFSALEEKVAGLEGLDAENPAPAPEPGE